VRRQVEPPIPLVPNVSHALFKTNPGPLEAIISRDPFIAGSVMFGSGRSYNGIIIAPAPSVVMNIRDKEQAAAYVDAIW